MMTREIGLAKRRNARVFKGIVNRDGHTITTDRFIRSARLDELSAEEISILTDSYQLHRVIDLRMENEHVYEAPDTIIPGVEYYNKNIVTPELERKLFPEGVTGLVDYIGKMPGMEHQYNYMSTLESSVKVMKEVFELIMSNDEGSVLWHCSEGKDRCGMVSAIFLSMLNVDRQTIMNDYLLSNEFCIESARAKADEVYRLSNDPALAQKALKLFTVDSCYLNAAFEAIDKTWGGMDEMICCQLEITEKDKQDFCARCLN